MSRLANKSGLFSRLRQSLRRQQRRTRARRLFAETLEDRLLLAADFGFVAAMGGPLNAVGGATVLDSSGNVYITGSFQGMVDFDPGAGVSNLTSKGNNDIHVTKLDSSGNLVWARSMGGTGNDQGLDIAVDGSGNVYVSGFFTFTADFDPGPGVSNLTVNGGGASGDMFVTKLDSGGNLAWAKSAGSTKGDFGKGVDVDSSGNVYAISHFQNTVDYDPGPGVFNLTSQGSNDVAIMKLNPSGNFVWAKRMGGPSGDVSTGITVDTADNVYATGCVQGTGGDYDPGPGMVYLTSNGKCDAFVSKLDSSGNFAWAASFGGTLNEFGARVAVDGVGNVYMSGRFEGTADFDPGVGVFNLTSNGDFDAYVSKLDSSGNFVWATSYGGTSFDVSTANIDGSGNVYVTGKFEGTVDFDPGPDVSNLTSNGDSDIYITRLDSAGNLAWAINMGGTGADQGRDIVVDGSDNIYVTGAFQDTVDFDPGAGVANRTSAGGNDIFVLQLTQGPTNSPPDVSVDNAVVTVNEGQTAVNSGDFFDPEGDDVTVSSLVGTSSLQFASEPFATDTPDATDGTYPEFTLNRGTARVIGGQLRLDGGGGQSIQNFTRNGFSRTQLVSGTVKANTGGGWNVGILLGNRRFIFHPGYSGGAFRIEEAAGAHLISNQNMGFTPSGTVAHPVEVAYDAGANLVTVTISDGLGVATPFVYNWTPNAGFDPSLEVGFTSSKRSLNAFYDDLEVAAGQSMWQWSFDTTNGPVESQTVTITAEDSEGGSSTVDFQLVVNNVAPD
ncbi:MAG: hypothetical protein GY903_29655, partial [Fuerstiella sp.]|nr:hypothetical protein [Fuerstiella sp.]